MGKRRQPAWLQTLIVLVVAIAVLGMAWVTQYAITKALQRPRAAGEPAPK